MRSVWSARLQRATGRNFLSTRVVSGLHDMADGTDDDRNGSRDKSPDEAALSARLGSLDHRLSEIRDGRKIGTGRSRTLNAALVKISGKNLLPVAALGGAAVPATGVRHVPLKGEMSDKGSQHDPVDFDFQVRFAAHSLPFNLDSGICVHSGVIRAYLLVTSLRRPFPSCWVLPHNLGGERKRP